MRTFQGANTGRPHQLQRVTTLGFCGRLARHRVIRPDDEPFRDRTRYTIQYLIRSRHRDSLSFTHDTQQSDSIVFTYGPADNILRDGNRSAMYCVFDKVLIVRRGIGI